MLRFSLISSYIAYFITIAFFFPESSHAARQHEISSLESDTVVVGFLQTVKEVYPEELTFSYNIREMLTGLGARVVRIDYNALLDLETLSEKHDSWVPGDKYKISDADFAKIKSSVWDFIQKENINRIFIPGNFYNVDCEPYTPTPNRQLITNAITEIVRENPHIRIMGVCGGLQGVMHSFGVKVTRVSNLVNSHESVALHEVSMPDPKKRNVPLHRCRIVPGSRLADIVSKYLSADVNGWFSIFFPDAHGGVISNNLENMKKIESLGYKVVGFSDDGMIEALEDMHGNILFQDHPEALAIGFLKGEILPVIPNHECESCHKSQDLRYKAALSAVSIMEDFLYHQ